MVKDGIKEAKSFITKKDPVLEEQKRRQTIMNDCITETLMGFDLTQLQSFVHVSNNLSAIIQQALVAHEQGKQRMSAPNVVKN